MMKPDDAPVAILEFFPSFLSPCKMELRRGTEKNWLLRVTVKSYDEDNERTWAAEANNAWYADKIIAFARTVVTQALKEDRTIIDGIRLRCSFTENDVEKVHAYICPEQSTPEWSLAGAFLVRAENLINDQELTNYLERLEGYFGRLPAKLFDEIPKRLRIYDRLSSPFSKLLAELIAKVANEQALVLDFTNLEGMGTFFHNQFEPIKKIRELKILVKAGNEEVLRHVKEIGFKDEQVVIV